MAVVLHERSNNLQFTFKLDPNWRMVKNEHCNHHHYLSTVWKLYAIFRSTTTTWCSIDCIGFQHEQIILIEAWTKSSWPSQGGYNVLFPLLWCNWSYLAIWYIIFFFCIVTQFAWSREAKMKFILWSPGEEGLVFLNGSQGIALMRKHSGKIYPERWLIGLETHGPAPGYYLHYSTSHSVGCSDDTVNPIVVIDWPKGGAVSYLRSIFVVLSG